MKDHVWKKRERAIVTGACVLLLSVTGIGGYGLTQLHAKTEYWEFGAGKGTDKQEQRENAFRYLEKYHVTYDEDTDSFFYDGRKIRWLIDEIEKENTQKCACSEDGIIDVYTVRDADGDLEGIRVAGEAEFRERTDKIKTAVLLEEDAVPEYEAVYEEDAASEYEDTYAGDVFSEYEGDGTPDRELLRALGLKKDSKGHWKYDGKTLTAIYIQGIGFTTWGDVEEDDTVFLYVTREKRDGEMVWKLSEVTEKELSEISFR